MVRKANQQDLPALAGLGARLWPGHTTQQLAAELAGTMSGADACFFLKLEGETPAALPKPTGSSALPRNCDRRKGGQRKRKRPGCAGAFALCADVP